jgi:hypothetical protein
VEIPVPIDNTLATSLVLPRPDKSADRLRKTFRWTGPASYTTGGEAVNVTTVFGMGRIDKWTMDHPSNGSVVIVALYDYTNAKIKYFDMAGVEITSTTDLSTYSFRSEIIGR